MTGRAMAIGSLQGPQAAITTTPLLVLALIAMAATALAQQGQMYSLADSRPDAFQRSIANSTESWREVDATGKRWRLNEEVEPVRRQRRFHTPDRPGLSSDVWRGALPRQ